MPEPFLACNQPVTPSSLPLQNFADPPGSTNTMSEPILFDSTFAITGFDQNKYDRVARISGEREDLKFSLDIHVELYPVAVGETVQLSLASTLSPDGAKEDPAESKTGWKENKAAEPSLADTYDYVCHGKVYRFEEGNGEFIKVFASFGGLLLFLEGPHKKLSSMRHEYVYLLMKK
ncbi:unnamed protein product [Tuber aestivum]|uniref:DNA-directed RNA polymerases I, II, and III subunit RPABC3 n=1 Tax=Tuber aestivum TaxID=59557 RepID=A0A292Q4H6_9PEZI|nr:unnamed protein product [Tuber aestivum]